MRAKITFYRVNLFALAAICFSPSLVYCQYGQYVEPQPPGGPQVAPASGKPSANSEIFKTLKAQCETDVACGKASGDVCANAAAILLGNDPPDDLRDLNELIKTKIALRLLEKGVDSSNLAASRAYDLYSKLELPLLGGLTGYSDPYRAKELMDMMLKRSYAGAVLRKARSAVSFFAITVTEADKKEACATARKYLADGKLDVDSAKLANDTIDSGYCKGLVQAPVN